MKFRRKFTKMIQMKRIGTKKEGESETMNTKSMETSFWRYFLSVSSLSSESLEIFRSRAWN